VKRQGVYINNNILTGLFISLRKRWDGDLKIHINDKPSAFGFRVGFPVRDSGSLPNCIVQTISENQEGMLEFSEADSSDYERVSSWFEQVMESINQDEQG